MKVSVYKGLGPEFAVLLEPSPGKGLHPVLVSRVLLEDLADRVRLEVDAMRGLSAGSPA